MVRTMILTSCIVAIVTGDTCASHICTDTALFNSKFKASVNCTSAGCDDAQCCSECKDDSHCKGITPKCSLWRNSCVECNDDSHCKGLKHKCSYSTNSCVECRGDYHCKDSTPACSSLTNTCVAIICSGKRGAECSQCDGYPGKQCTTTDEVGFCDPGLRNGARSICCVECNDDVHCLKDPIKPKCSKDAGLCIELDCGGQLGVSCPACEGYFGKPCSTDDVAGICSDGENFRCVECTADSHCTDPKPKCSLLTRSCVAINCPNTTALGLPCDECNDPSGKRLRCVIQDGLTGTCSSDGKCIAIDCHETGELGSSCQACDSKNEGVKCKIGDGSTGTCNSKSKCNGCKCRMGSHCYQYYDFGHLWHYEEVCRVEKYGCDDMKRSVSGKPTYSSRIPCAKDCTFQNGFGENDLKDIDICKCGTATCDAMRKYCDVLADAIGRCTATAKVCAFVNGFQDNTLSGDDECMCGTTTCDATTKYCDATFSTNGSCTAKAKPCTSVNGFKAETLLSAETCTCGTATCVGSQFCDAPASSCSNSAANCRHQDGLTSNKLSVDETCTCRDATCGATENYCTVTQAGGACSSTERKVDCGMSKWSLWSICSVTCGDGLSTRMRNQTTPASNGGDCGNLTDSRSCNVSECPVLPCTPCDECIADSSSEKCGAQNTRADGSCCDAASAASAPVAAAIATDSKAPLDIKRIVLIAAIVVGIILLILLLLYLRRRRNRNYFIFMKHTAADRKLPLEDGTSNERPAEDDVRVSNGVNQPLECRPESEEQVCANELSDRDISTQRKSTACKLRAMLRFETTVARRPSRQSKYNKPNSKKELDARQQSRGASSSTCESTAPPLSQGLASGSIYESEMKPRHVVQKQAHFRRGASKRSCFGDGGPEDSEDEID
eukprot:GEMP01011481.1.p1 GENE.GEMP01011481.1~~GEMP01011481.1.p1  ORF type:complete len:896 (+),score=99.50 GEMP01011481.1:94-2781(+)